MKNFTCFKVVILLLYFSSSIAQVGIGTASPEATLDIRATTHNGPVSTDDGLLVPRVNDLVNDGSINGQLVYLIADTGDYNAGFHFWDGATWQPLVTPGSLGAKELILTAEYAGAVVLDPEISGGGSDPAIGELNGDFSPTFGNEENIYLWETTETTNQVIEVRVAIPLPSDFTSWPNSGPFLTLSKEGSVSFGSFVSEASGLSHSISETDNGNSVDVSFSFIPNSSPGDIFIFSIELTATNGTPAQIGTLTLNYE